jgi:hypothetical protein
MINNSTETNVFVVCQPGSHSNPTSHYLVTPVREVSSVLAGEVARAYGDEFVTYAEAVNQRDIYNGTAPDVE